MRIMLCVNNQILCDGLKKVLDEVLPGNCLMDRFSTSDAEPELVLFDSAAEVETIMDHYPGAKFICLDLGLNDSEIASLLFCHGVSGIISPRLDMPMFVKAIRKVYGGELWIGQDYLRKAMTQRAPLLEGRNHRVLSEQDKRIVDLVVLGRKNGEIADALCLSESTVKAHVSRIYRTLKVKNRAQLACLAATGSWHSNPPHHSFQ